MKTQILRLTVAVTLFAISLSAQSNNDAQQSLIQAIQRNDAASVSRLIASGADPNVKDADGVPALMLATLFADAACVEQLLKQGADPNQADTAGATALMWAMPDIQKARVLIEHGANVNARSTNLGRPPLLVAAAYPGTVDLLDLLLARGADLRARDTAGNSAFAMAMRSADVGVLRFLSDKGLDPKDEVPAAAVSAVYTRARPAVIDYAMGLGLTVPKDILARASNWQSPELIKRWIERGRRCQRARRTLHRLSIAHRDGFRIRERRNVADSARTWRRSERAGRGGGETAGLGDLQNGQSQDCRAREIWCNTRSGPSS